MSINKAELTHTNTQLTTWSQWPLYPPAVADKHAEFAVEGGIVAGCRNERHANIGGFCAVPWFI